MRRSSTATSPRASAVKTLTYRYLARGDQNRVVKGTIKAVSEVAAQHLLVDQGYTPVSLNPVPSALSLEGALPSMFGVKPRQVITFSQQLATLLESGVSLLPALQLLESQMSGSQAFGRIVRSIAQDLGSGRSFAQAIARHPTAFNDLYIRTIAVGERTGKLETVLREMAEYMEKQSAFAKKVSGALTYPAIVLGVAMIVSIILLTVVLPPLSKLFETMHADLPLPTRVLMALSRFMNANILYLLAGFVVGLPVLLWLMRQPRGRRIMDNFRLYAPMIGQPTRLAELARLSRTMSVLLKAGLALQEIVDLLPQTTTNSVLREALVEVKRGLFLGQGLSYPMSAYGVFPPLFLQMVRVGEESNTLGNNLTVLANFYETTADEKTSAMLSMIQPASTMFIAAVAAFIALSVIMPMYSITGAF